MMTATYYNSALKETYTISGVKDLAQAWNLAEFACYRADWNVIDLTKVTLSERKQM